MNQKISQPTQKDKRWLIVFIVAIIIFISTSLFIKNKQNKTSPKENSNSWQGITPGQVFTTNLQKQLGSPLSVEQDDQNINYNYQSEFPSYNTVVRTNSENKVIFIKERLDYNPQHNLQQYIDKYGQPQLLLSDNQIGDSVKVNVFLTQGIAILSHIPDGSVEAKWYFTPMNEEDFISAFKQEIMFNDKEQGFEAF